MTSEQILLAFTDISDRYILSAQKNLGTMWETPITKGKKHPSVRKLLILAAVLTVLVSVMLTTALAVSPEFREKVFRFLRVDQIQVIPETPVDTQVNRENMIVEPTVVIQPNETDPVDEIFGSFGKQVITGAYVHTPVASHARNGVFLVCKDDVVMKQGNHYDAYYMENGAMIPIAEQSFCQDYRLHGHQIHVEFNWVEHNGQVHITYADPEVRFRTYNGAGSAEAVLFCFELQWELEKGEYRSGWYPVLLNLYTGEISELLKDTEIEWLPYIDSAALSEDGTKLLLRQKERKTYTLYCVDLAAKKTWNLDTLSGEHVDACSIIGEKLACWQVTEDVSGDRYKAWSIDLTTLERKALFDDVVDAAQTKKTDAGIVFLEGFDGRSHWGNMFTGCRFALMVDQAQNAFVFDLGSGEKYMVEEFAWFDYVSYIPSPDGKRLLLSARSQETRTISQIAVLDYDRQTLLQFSRENPNNITEHMAYWFDRNTVVVCSETYADSLATDFYLYSFVPAD